jgi:putative transposase
VKYGAVEQSRQRWPVPPMCQLLGVSVAGYYAWKKRGPSSRTMRQPRLQAEIIAMHKRTRETFGPERLQRELGAAGVEIGVYSIKRIRKTLGLRCKQKKKFKATTNSRHNLPVASNLLKQDFKVDAPNRAWVTDINNVFVDQGRLAVPGRPERLVQR